MTNASTTSAPTTPENPNAPYVWQTHLDASTAVATEYHEYLNPMLLNLFARPPRRLMDIGCAAGLLGSVMKEKYGCYTVGFEMNQAAAEMAKTKLDRVFCGKFEAFDLPAEGIAHGSIDTVVLADVLEHMYDPWHVMVNLKPFLTPDAQVIISIPNVRNLGLILGLADRGEWKYDARGLLDITHIRFFTLSDFAKLMEQTGYQIERVDHMIDGSLATFYEQNKNKEKINLQSGRFRMEKLSPSELAEMCAFQFFIRAKPVLL